MIRIVGENKIAVGRADPAPLSRVARIHDQRPRTGQGHTGAVQGEEGVAPLPAIVIVPNW
jgi:hypothetical protein